MNAQTHYLEDENNKLKERIDELGLILHSRNEQYREHRAEIIELEAENQRLKEFALKLYESNYAGEEKYLQDDFKNALTNFYKTLEK